MRCGSLGLFTCISPLCSPAVDFLSLHFHIFVIGFTAGEGTNGNCSEGTVNPEPLEEVQIEAEDMLVDRQFSPAPETCDGVRPETTDEQHGNGNLTSHQRSLETNSLRQEPPEELRKVSHEPSLEGEDGREDPHDKDGEMFKSLKPRIDALKAKLVAQTKGFGVFRLEMLHANICRLLQHGHGDSCSSRLASLEAFMADELNLT